jgi:hypothetical protein
MLTFHLTIVVDITLEDVFFASSLHLKLHLIFSFGAYQTLVKGNLKLGIMTWMFGSTFEISNLKESREETLNFMSIWAH